MPYTVCETVHVYVCTYGVCVCSDTVIHVVLDFVRICTCVKVFLRGWVYSCRSVYDCFGTHVFQCALFYILCV